MNDTDDLKVKDVLVKAKQLIKEKGWIQGVNYNANGYCMVGAFNEVTRGVSDQVYLKAHNRIVSICKNMAEYNDKLNRTKEEVLATFDKAIANCS